MKKNVNPKPLKEDITYDEKVEKANNGVSTVILSRSKRCWVFVYIIIVNIFINFDHGYFPAATEEFKKDFQINSSLLGLFGSSVYFGNLIGKIF